MIFNKRYRFTNPDNVPNSLFKYDNPMYTDKIHRLYAWAEGRPMPPFKMVIVPTNRCNLKCFCCPNSYARKVGRFKKGDELSDKDWLSIIKEALDMGVKEFYILGGGEPMLRGDLVLEMIRRIKKVDQEYVTEIISNGTLFRKEFCEELVRLKHNRMLFSIDGSDSETHDYVRGVPGAFEKVKETVKEFVRQKKIQEKDKPILQMNTVISNKNHDKIEDIVKFALEIGFDELALHPMREYEEVKEDMQHLKLTDEQEETAREQIRKAKEIVKGTGLFLNVSMVDETDMKDQKESSEMVENNSMSDPKHDEKQLDVKTEKQIHMPMCFEPFYSIFIDPKGNYNFCCAAGDGKDEDSIKPGLKSAWKSKFFSDIRNSLLEHVPTEKCANCGLLDMTSELRENLIKYNDFVNKHRD